MAQVFVPQKKDNSALTKKGGEAGGQALGDAILPGFGGIVGGSLGGSLGAQAGATTQVQGVQSKPVELPQVGQVPMTEAPQYDQEAVANNNEALKRRLATLNQIADQSRG